ncbi:MAG: MFS transporter [Candidatus Heimdallarchaeota archaeon]|nr:MFS transporter [Candidatus Heimdallarchaeota archaeon]MCK4769952.1 MFS transporter [Candidatus Heimdallarchaeota archaeon]
MSEVFEEEEVELETKTSKKNVLIWSLYDLANTVYSMVIVSLIINQYILIIGQQQGLSYTRAEIMYDTVIMVMQIVIAIGMPIVGALSDTVGRRKPFVIILTGIILIFASLLGLSHSLWLVLLLYVIANMAYQWSLGFYDPMLPFIAAPKDAGKVGGFGVAFGYFGTIIGILVMMILQGTLGFGLFWGSPNSNPDAGPIELGYLERWETFVIAMAIFLVFAIPFLWVKERKKKSKTPPIGQLIKKSFSQLAATFKDIRGHKEMFKFIIGYFLIVEVANIVVIKMILIVTDGMGMSYTFSQYFIIIATISAVIFTFPVGLFADKKGAKASFILVCALWAAALIISIIAITAWPVVETPEFLGGEVGVGITFPFIMVLLMGILAGPAMGGTWVAQRYMIIELAPKEKFGEYFGFSKLSGKVSASIGPIIWGAMIALSTIVGLKVSYALAIAVVGVIMLIGLVIILFVKPEKKILQEAGAEPEK